MNWPTKKLGEVADVLMGQSPPSSTYNLKDEGLPFFQGKAEFGDLYPAIDKYCSSPVRIANGGDILLSVRAPVGPINIAKEKICIGRGLASIRAKKNISDQWYLYYLLKQKEDKWDGSTGSTFQAINRQAIEDLLIPVPVVGVQIKIVERLDAIRQTQELSNQQIQKTEELFDSMMIEIEKVKGSRVKISEICFVKGGKRIPKGLTFSSKVTNHPYLRVADFKDNSINLENLKYIDDLVFKKISNYIISKNDIYISIAGTTGLIGSIPENLDGASLTENAAKLMIKDNKIISRKYLVYSLLIPSNQSSFKASTHNTSVGKLALFRIQNISINLPEVKDQQKIVERLEAVQDYKKLLQKQKSLFKELFDSILDKSMKGELDN